MFFAAVFLVCAQALFLNTAGQCIGPIIDRYLDAPWGSTSLASPCAPFAAPFPGPRAGYRPKFPAINGGGFTTTSSSPLVPTGVSVVSENAYEGLLAVRGALPFLGAVALEGALPTAGAGAVAYGCGSGAVGITAEDIGLVGPYTYDADIAGPLEFEAGLAVPLGLEPAIGYGPGYGCGVF